MVVGDRGRDTWGGGSVPGRRTELPGSTGIIVHRLFGTNRPTIPQSAFANHLSVRQLRSFGKLNFGCNCHRNGLTNPQWHRAVLQNLDADWEALCQANPNDFLTL